MSRIIALANQKGGVGKTTSAINIAAYLAKMGRSVLLVDLDPQGNSSSGLGYSKSQVETSLYEVISGSQEIGSAIIHTPYNKLDLVAANNNLAGAELSLTRVPSREFVLKKIIEPLNYDYILIDCPPSLGLLTLNGLVAANYLLIPTQVEFYALEGLSQLLNTVKRVRSALNPNLKLLGVVATMYDGRMSLSSAVMAELNKHFDKMLFDTTVPRNIRLAEAPSHGKPIYAYDRFCKGAFAYKKLTKEIVKRVEHTNQ